MPGSDDQYDQVHTYSQDHAGKSKTTKPAVREIGRDGAPVELFVGTELTVSDVRTPPAGVLYLFFDTNGDLRAKDSAGTVGNLSFSDTLAGDYGSPVDIGKADLDADTTNIWDDSANVLRADVNNSLVITEQESITSDVIRVFGSGSGFYEDRLISDYADIGAAINQAVSDGARAIGIPSGTFSYSTTIDVTSTQHRIRLYGAGADNGSPNTTLDFTGTGQAIVVGSSHNIWLEHLSLTGPGSQSGVDGVDYSNVLRSREVWVTSFQRGFVASGADPNYTRIHDTTVQSCDKGIETGGNSVGITGCRIGPNDSEGVVLTDFNVLYIGGGTAIEQSGLNGIFAATTGNNPRSLLIENCYFEGNGGGGNAVVTLDGDQGTGMKGATVRNCYFSPDTNATEAVNVGGNTVGTLLDQNVVIGGGPPDAYTIRAGAEKTRILGRQNLINPSTISDSGTDTKIEGMGVTTISRTPGFGTWDQPSSTRPSFVFIEVSAQTDGTSDGNILLDVDENGDSTMDWGSTGASADPDLPSGASIHGSHTIPLPPGGQYRLRNNSDPNGVNAINNVRVIVF